MIVSKIASAIFNDVQGGLAGYEATVNMSLDQLEDEVVEERLFVIKQYSMKNIIPKKDLCYSLNCITLDCQSMDKCICDQEDYSQPVPHFEIPQIINDFGADAIEFIGSTDHQIKFKVYTGSNFKFHKYKTRRKNTPYVYVDTTPNVHNMCDCYVFNAPLLERLSVVAIFKDPRQVEKYMKDHGCCEMSEQENYTWLATEVKSNLIKKKLTYYRQYYPQYNPAIQGQPNDQTPK